jgi:uncharacterized surface protein with fasciclin (FAS1) repeats
MTRFTVHLRFALVVALGLSLAACDMSEQNISWDSGNSLSLVGPLRAGSTASADDDSATPGIQLYLPVHPGDLSNNTVHFYIRGFNSDRAYSWTVNGASSPNLQEGEFTATAITAPGTYTVQATNDRQISGERVVTALFPALPVQIPRFSAWSTFRSALSGTELITTLGTASPFTVLAPVNAAFEGVTLPEDEEAVEEILSHHVIAGTLRLADITDGLTRTTLSGETVVFQRSGDQVTVGIAGGSQATLVGASDIQAANGVVHSINAILLPGD